LFPAKAMRSWESHPEWRSRNESVSFELMSIQGYPSDFADLPLVLFVQSPRCVLGVLMIIIIRFLFSRP
jgi:hypothetical protein